MKTTLNEIRKNDPCVDGWKKLLVQLGKTDPDDEPLSIITILDSNGLDDALWALRAVTGHDREIRLFAVWCGRQVQHLMIDPRSIFALDVAERFANGEASAEELAAARSAAESAARSAWFAWSAAESAAWAARSAACSAAESACSAAESAESAAWAARSAACSAAESAGYAAESARDAQAKRLREICTEKEPAK